jgi:hypothetical protein
MAAIGDPVLISLALIVHCISFIARQALSKSNKEKLNLMSTFSVGVAITAAGNTVFAYRLGLYGLSKESMYAYVKLDFVREAAALWSIGNSFVFIGYEWARKQTLPPLSVVIDKKYMIENIFKISLFLAVLSASGNLLNLAFISGGAQKTLMLFNQMGVLFFARLWGKENSRKYMTYAIILCVFRVISALIQAYLRIELLEPIIVISGGYFIGRGSFKELYSWRVIPAIAVLGIFVSMFGSLGSKRGAFLDAFKNNNQETTVLPSYAVLSVEESDRGNVLIRGSNLAQISNIFQLVEHKGYYNGEASLPLVYAFIPRVLWPEKPSVELGSWFALEIGVATVSQFTGRSNNSVNMSIPGQLYLDFGWLGVALGGILIGRLLAQFWNAGHFDDPYNILGAMWGGYMLFYSLFGVGADLQIFVTFISTYLVFLTIRYILTPYANTVPRTLVEG